MNNLKIQEGFELEINSLDLPVEKPNTRDMSLWLNNAVYKFVNTRYSGFNIKQRGFEQDQKRTDDLRKLVKTHTYTFDVHSGIYTAQFPADYLRFLGDTASIASNTQCWPKQSGKPIEKTTDTLEATVENFDKQKSNSLSEYRLRNKAARPLRLIEGDTVKLYTDGLYYITNYTMTYLRLPGIIDLSKPFEDYNDLPEDAIKEVIKMAASMYLENQANPRYESHFNEINSME